MDKRIIHYVEHQQDAMTNFLGDLIRIQTVNPPGKDYLDCVRFLHQRLEALGFTSRILEVPDREVQRHHPENARYPRFNVLANWDVGAKKTLHFNAHYDVVPVSGKWRGKPFSGSLHGGQVHGRGSADMKGSIASFLHAMEAFRSARLSPAFNIEVSFVCDEETGGHLGTQFLTQNYPLKADIVIVGEGAHGLSVGVGHNGVIWIKVEILGKSAHASRPGDGQNAFEAAAGVVCGLADYREVISTRSFKPTGGRNLTPTLCVGGTFGQGPGGKTNIVPDSAWFTLDRRVLPNEDIADAEVELINAIETAGKGARAKLKIECLHQAGSYCTDPDGPFPRSFSRSVASVLHGESKPFVTPGFTDARFFGTDLGLPTIGYGPSGVRYHAPNEAVKVDSLVKTSLVYAHFLTHASG